MKNSFRKALSIFRYLFILYTITYWIYVVIDDWGFIEKYWDENWLMYTQIWMAYFLAYLFVFSIYYWLAASAVILIYHKLIKRQ